MPDSKTYQPVYGTINRQNLQGMPKKDIVLQLGDPILTEFTKFQDLWQNIVLAPFRDHCIWVHVISFSSKWGHWLQFIFGRERTNTFLLYEVILQDYSFKKGLYIFLKAILQKCQWVTLRYI